MAHAWDRVGGVTISGTNRRRIADCEPLLLRLATEQGKEPIDLFSAAVKRFKEAPATVEKRLGLAVFMSQLETWCAEPVARATQLASPTHAQLPDKPWLAESSGVRKAAP